MISKLTTSSPVISQLRGNCFGIDYASNSFSPMLYNFLANPKIFGGSILTPFVVFFKSTFFRVRVKPCSFFTLILSKVTSFLNVLLKFFKHAEKNENFLFQCQLFSAIFRIFWHFLVTKKLIASAYNRWRQHFLPSTYSKSFFNSCIKLCWY